MFKFTLVGDDLETVRKLLVDAVIAATNRMQEDMSIEGSDYCDSTIRTMKHMQEIALMSELYLKSINQMESINGVK